MGMIRWITFSWLPFAGAICGQIAVDWQPARVTSVVFNADYPESESLAKYYAERRGIPMEKLIGLHCSQEEAITREAYDKTIREPLTSKLPADTSVLVLMRGVPAMIIRQKENPKPSKEDEASVDSELACLRMGVTALDGPVTNPYFNQPKRFADTPSAARMLLVGRLDAASSDTVRRMIDDSLAVEKTGLRGRAVIDLALKQGAYQEGEEWLRRSVQTYRSKGIPTYADRYEPVIRDGWPLPDTALYFGWYVDTIAGALKNSSFRFKRGAVACHLHSYSAGVIRTTTKNWVGPLLDRGAAATMGNVWEPYLSLTVHFDVFNERLLRGDTLIEAAWCATPGLSWMSVVIGDPLYRPFAASALGVDRDYAIYKAIVERHASDPDSAKLKREVLEAAQTRESPQLIEFLSLLSSQESKPTEAINLLIHARSLYEKPEDRLRTIIYEVELLRRDHDRGKDQEALKLLKSAAVDEGLKTLPGIQLVNQLIAELGG